MTGEHAVLYELANRDSVPCWLEGYPVVVLSSASGGVLRFRYVDGGGPYVTASEPETVVLAPGVSGYILVAMVIGDSGAAGLSYCRGASRTLVRQWRSRPLSRAGRPS